MVAAAAVTATATATAWAAACNCLASASGIENGQLSLRIPAFAFYAFYFLVCLGHGANRLELLATVLAFILVDRHNDPYLTRL
jgi:hypothetical protein